MTQTVQVTDSSVAMDQSRSAAATSVYSRAPYTLTVDATGLIAVFDNFIVVNATAPVTGAVDSDPTTSVTLKASWEIDGDIIPMTFGGLQTVTLSPGAIIHSDPLNRLVPIAKKIYVRSFQVGTVKYNFNSGQNGPQYGYSDTTGTDNTVPGSPTPTTGYGLYAGPTNILGTTNDTKRPLLVWGDSQGLTGWADQLARATGRGILNISRGGQTAVGDSVPFAHRRRMSLVIPGMLPIFGMGTNDSGLAGASTAVLAAWVSMWKTAKSLGCVKGVGQTVFPRTSSTDSWATLANQTTTASITTQVEAYNAWLRAGAPLDPITLTAVAVGTAGARTCNVYSNTGAVILTGSGGHLLDRVVDVAAAFESSSGSGKWKATAGGITYTADGTHTSGNTATQAIYAACFTAGPPLV